MLKIGICDDSEHDMNLIRERLVRELFDYEDISIATYSSGEEVIAAIEGGSFDSELLLLDIMMTPPDGMDVAQYIRQNRIDVDIIFVSASAEYVYQGYIYKAFSYILKQHAETELGREVCRYIDELDASEECLNVTSRGKNRRVPVSSIRYIESRGRVLVLHLDREEVPFYAKMSEIEEVLSERGFVRTHQSFMINRSDIVSMTAEQADCGSYTVPVSRRYYKAVRDALLSSEKGYAVSGRK